MLSLKNLPLRNLRGYAGRTAALLVFSALMSMAVFCGTVLTAGTREGLATVQSRLGADIMVTPESAKNDFDAQTVLIQSDPGYFYMEREKLDEISAVDGIAQISPQVFMASAKAGCCSARLQMIAYDPETDFTIRPWIADTYTSGGMGLMDVVVGSNVTVYDNHEILFYDRTCRIIGQFAPTGSTLDNCVYMTVDTVKELIRASFEKGLNLYPEYDPDDVISSVMIRVREGEEIEEVAQRIRESVDGVNVATSKNMVAGIGESLARSAKSIALFTRIFWLIGFLMTLLLFAMMMNERKREFASLRAMGAGKRILSSIILVEALLVNLAGGLIGTGTAAVILVMFRGLFAELAGGGFVLPGVGSMLLMAAAALTSAVSAALLSSFIAIRMLGRMDAALVLKEGE